MRRLLAAWLLPALASLAHAQEAGAPLSDAPDLPQPVQAGAPADPAYLGEGLASWYGLRFQGRRTASGERFNMHAFTAAHPFLPFGTLVQVRSQLTGRSVIVRINDRGPHQPGRLIDLSHAAARALGLLGLGTKSVVLSLAPGPDEARPAD